MCLLSVCYALDTTEHSAHTCSFNSLLAYEELGARRSSPLCKVSEPLLLPVWWATIFVLV